MCRLYAIRSGVCRTLTLTLTLPLTIGWATVKAAARGVWEVGDLS